MPSHNMQGSAQVRKAFASHFREHLAPRLRNLILAEARCVVAGVLDYTGACSAVLHYACRYGALRLPEREFHLLDDWIGAETLRLVLAMEADPARPWADWLAWVERLTDVPMPATCWPARAVP